jgi:hypothetical protein
MKAEFLLGNLSIVNYINKTRIYSQKNIFLVFSGAIWIQVVLVEVELIIGTLLGAFYQIARNQEKNHVR